jgi:hypothetical protein
LKKSYSRCGARIFGFWQGCGEGAGLNNPVTEPKRRQKPKRPLAHLSQPHGYNFSENAPKPKIKAPQPGIKLSQS